MLKYLLIISLLSFTGSLNSQCFNELTGHYVPKGYRETSYDSTLKFIGQRFDPLPGETLPDRLNYVSMVIHKTDTIFIYSVLDSIENFFGYTTSIGYKEKILDSTVRLGNNLHLLGTNADYLRLKVHGNSVAENGNYKLISLNVHYPLAMGKASKFNYCELFLIHKKSGKLKYISYMDHAGEAFYLDEKGNIFIRRTDWLERDPFNKNRELVFLGDTMMYETTFEYWRNDNDKCYRIGNDEEGFYWLDLYFRKNHNYQCKNLVARIPKKKLDYYIKKAFKMK